MSDQFTNVCLRCNMPWRAGKGCGCINAYSPADTAEPDMVNNPPHYTQGGIECIDAIRAALTPEEFRGYAKGNALKYLWREMHKGGDTDLCKAAWYLDMLTESK